MSFFWRFCPFFYIICKRPPFSAVIGRFSAPGFCWLLALLRFVGTATIAFIKRSTFLLPFHPVEADRSVFHPLHPGSFLGATAGLSEKYRRPDLFLHSGLHPFGDQNTLIHTVSFALEMISPRRAVLLDTLYAAQDPIYPQKIHWDEISVDIQFLLEGDCSPAHQKQTVYQSHRTYFAVLNYFHYCIF